MRPPHAAAEKPGCPGVRTRTRTRFNEAAARGGGKDAGRVAARLWDGASMRPPHAAAEKKPRRERGKRGVMASMRPPHAAAEKAGLRWWWPTAGGLQ